MMPLGPSARVGLAPSDIPEAGWGVFALRDLSPGTHVLEYGGVQRTRDWVEDPQNDARYVWSDENMADELAATGRSVLYLDANPAVTDSWGGRVNDGFHRGANLTTVRLPNRDKVMLKVTVPITAGEELYLSYGADYWQGHFFDLPLPVQADAAAHYDLTAIGGRCYTPAQRAAAAAAGQIHKLGGTWYVGPRDGPPRQARKAPPQPPRLPLRGLTPHAQRTNEARPPCSPKDHPPPDPAPPGPSQAMPPPPLPPGCFSPDPPGSLESDLCRADAAVASTSPPPPSPDERARSAARSLALEPPAFPVSKLPWGDLLSTTMGKCIRIGWAPTVATLQALEELLSSPAPDLGQLFARATALDSTLAFRYWRLPTGPLAPWFHPGPLDGIIADYMMKARAASGLRSPKRHGTLDPADPADAKALFDHCQGLGLVRDPDRRWSPEGNPHAWARASHLSATSLGPLMDPDRAYTCFVTQTDPPPADTAAMLTLCYADSRIDVC